MIYDLSQPIFNNVPQWPKFRPTTMTIPHLTAIESANVEHLDLMTHTGTHVDAPFHFFPEAETIDALPLSHFHAPCIALDLRHKEPGSDLAARDFERHADQIKAGMIVLLKTGWAEKRALTKEFLTAWPYLTGEGAEYLISLGIHGVGIEGLSIGGYDDPEKETAAHKVLLSRKKLIIEDIRVPDAMIDGRIRHFAAFPVLIRGAGGAWTRAVAWDTGELA
ncbi:cyclase family protein [Acidicapsa dinghuensis]|uniref:Cyclase family protein n=1 Tax=Acidicapsa dinghuensis TaxID=2218256 RepID=A0ABW1ECW3_9BACT|nr:cyclase family protein [Acidicapsa dinghuensis]